MSLLNALIATVVRDTSPAEASETGRSVLVAAVLAIGALIAGLASIGCVLSALWIALLPWAGSAGAPLIVGGVLAVLTLCAAIAVRMILQAPPSVVRTEGLTPRLPGSQATPMELVVGRITIEVASRIIQGFLRPRRARDRER